MNSKEKNYDSNDDRPNRDAVTGVLHGDEALTVTGVSTDSRQINPGDWFVPILGERFDGHDYIDKALEAGAGGLLLRPSAPGAAA